MPGNRLLLCIWQIAFVCSCRLLTLLVAQLLCLLIDIRSGVLVSAVWATVEVGIVPVDILYCALHPSPTCWCAGLAMLVTILVVGGFDRVARRLLLVEVLVINLGLVDSAPHIKILNMLFTLLARIELSVCPRIPNRKNGYNKCSNRSKEWSICLAKCHISKTYNNHQNVVEEGKYPSEIAVVWQIEQRIAQHQRDDRYRRYYPPICGVLLEEGQNDTYRRENGVGFDIALCIALFSRLS